MIETGLRSPEATSSSPDPSLLDYCTLWRGVIIFAASNFRRRTSHAILRSSCLCCRASRTPRRRCQLAGTTNYGEYDQGRGNTNPESNHNKMFFELALRRQWCLVRVVRAGRQSSGHTVREHGDRSINRGSRNVYRTETAENVLLAERLRHCCGSCDILHHRHDHEQGHNLRASSRAIAGTGRVSDYGKVYEVMERDNGRILSTGTRKQRGGREGGVGGIDTVADGNDTELTLWSTDFTYLRLQTSKLYWQKSTRARQNVVKVIDRS